MVSDGNVSDSAIVMVTILDGNDEKPVYLGPSSFEITEEGDPHYITTLNFTDYDQYPNNVVSSQDFFEITASFLDHKVFLSSLHRFCPGCT